MSQTDGSCELLEHAELRNESELGDVAPWQVRPLMSAFRDEAVLAWGSGQPCGIAPFKDRRAVAIRFSMFLAAAADQVSRDIS
jgi:hypothetical protein